MVYLFLGEEGFLRKQALDKLKFKLWGGVMSSLNYDEFYTGEDDLNKIIDCAKTPPFMAKFRMVVIKEINRFNSDEKEILAFFIANKPSDIVMVLMVDSLAPSDLIYKTITKHGRIINFDPLRGDRLHKWISDRFLDLKKR